MRHASWREEIDQKAFEAREAARAKKPVPQPTFFVRATPITVPEPAGLDLTDFVNTAFSGENPEVNVGAARTQDDACALIEAVLETRIDRGLSPHERGQIGWRVASAWNRRERDNKAALSETQRALHRPGSLAS